MIDLSLPVPAYILGTAMVITAEIIVIAWQEMVTVKFCEANGKEFRPSRDRLFDRVHPLLMLLAITLSAVVSTIQNGTPQPHVLLIGALVVTFFSWVLATSHKQSSFNLGSRKVIASVACFPICIWIVAEGLMS